MKNTILHFIFTLGCLLILATPAGAQYTDYYLNESGSCDSVCSAWRQLSAPSKPELKKRNLAPTAKARPSKGSGPVQTSRAPGAKQFSQQAAPSAESAMPSIVERGGDVTGPLQNPSEVKAPDLGSPPSSVDSSTGSIASTGQPNPPESTVQTNRPDEQQQSLNLPDGSTPVRNGRLPAVDQNTSEAIAILYTSAPITDLDGLERWPVAIDARNTWAIDGIKKTLQAAGLSDVKLDAGKEIALTRLFDKEVFAAVVAIVPAEVAENYPELPNYSKFKILVPKLSPVRPE